MLHRTALVALLLALVCSTLYSQRRPRGPRALAVMEVLANGRTRLVPVTIFNEGRFWDANLYHATPRPMALEYDTLYDVLRSGKQVGAFTVTTATLVDGTWLGGGTFKEQKEPVPEAVPGEIRLGGKPAPKHSDEDEDKPPILRRPGTDSTTDSSSKEAPHANQPEPSKTREAEKPQPAPAEDPNRPTLKRGAGTQVKAESPSEIKLSAALKESLTAISDPRPYDYRSYAYELKPEESDRYARLLGGLAQSAIARFAQTHSTAGKPAPGPLQDIKLSALDADASNELIVVLTARQPGLPRSANATTAADARFQFTVTLVSRITAEGEARPLLTQVTDALHLDAIPRLELVDAVDAEGTGRAQLLFRQVYDTGRAFALFRIGADRLWPLFEGSTRR